MVKRHVILDQGDCEYSACGYACNAATTEDDPEAMGVYVDAKPGVVVTCPECCEAIKRLRNSMRGLRLRAST